VIKAQVELGKLEDRLTTLMDRRIPVSAKLNALLGRTDDTLLPWPADAPEDSSKSTLNAERLSELLEQSNPELKRAASMVAREEARVALAKRNYYPDFGFGLDYVFTDKSDIGDPEGSGKDAVVAMVSLNIPIYTGKYRAARREAEAAHLAAEMSLQNTTNHLKASLQNALFEFRDAERKIGLYRDTLLPKANQALEVARQAFEGGGADFLDLIDAERTLLEFDLSYARALRDRAIRHAQIKMLLGADMAATFDPHDSESVSGMHHEQ
jgi:outer membrane protein TolC